MGLFSFARDDRVVFAGLGVATLGVMALMRVLLANYRDGSELKPIRPKTQYITQETEDSLKLGTLESLLGHYNFAIRETAAKIVCDRAVNDGTSIHQLLWGITRPDYDERIRNLRALMLITDQRKHFTQFFVALLARSQFNTGHNRQPSPPTQCKSLLGVCQIDGALRDRRRVREAGRQVL